MAMAVLLGRQTALWNSWEIKPVLTQMWSGQSDSRESDLVIHQFQFHLYPIGGEVHQVALLVGGQFIAGHFLAVHRHHRPVALDGGLGLAVPENPGYKSQKGQDKDQVAFLINARWAIQSSPNR